MDIASINQAVIDQQSEASEYQGNSALIARESLPLLYELIESKLIIVITGIRRSGKSTLALQALKEKNFLYFNFDDEVLGQSSAKDLNKILACGLSINPSVEYLLFDEIQNIENWELFINRLQRRKYKIIITGSNSRLLSTELSSHLTGRHLSLSLYPFSYTEYLKCKKIELPKHFTTAENAFYKKEFLSYLVQGGFPQILQYLPSDRVFKLYLKELFDKIVTRDIVQRRKIKNIKTMRELALLALSLYSSRFTYQSLKKSCAINSVNTVKNYIDYLQESYLIFVLEPYSAKAKERISLPKKLYTIDTALLEAIIPKTTEDLGRKLENIVFIELKRRSMEVYYFHAPTYEVDFAIREGNKIVQLIQVAWSIDNELTKQREIKSLIKAARHLKVKELSIITENTEGEEIAGEYAVKIIPVWKWLLNH